MTTTSATSSSSSSTSSFQLESWSINYHPFHHHDSSSHHSHSEASCNGNSSSSLVENPIEGILLASIPIIKLFNGNVGGKTPTSSEAYKAFMYETSSTSRTSANNNNVMAKAARVALADYTMRSMNKLLSSSSSSSSNNDGRVVVNNVIALSTMEQARHHHKQHHSNSSSSTNVSQRIQEARQRKQNLLSLMRGKKEEVPFVLERSDCYVVDNKKGGDDDTVELQFFLHVGHNSRSTTNNMQTSSPPSPPSSSTTNNTIVQDLLSNALQNVLPVLMTQLSSHECFSHIASVVLQRQLRSMLQPPPPPTTSSSRDDQMINNEEQSNKSYLNAVAFIADGSILPRKSGRSTLPMSTPPAVPFTSPAGSEQLTKVVGVYVGEFWACYLQEVQQYDATNDPSSSSSSSSLSSPATTTTIKLRGMIIPQGVTLIVGGGYHGKSTILQALSYGVYDKIPGDGREYVVSHSDAVSIRAEDGRYVNNVNISAFINSIPSGKTINGASISCTSFDTSQFSTMDASGSTSQAANVIEALECRASALLVDEDVSAANFMARDGRMRAMISEEPITPLLYRVNGLYLSKEHKTSTVVVVGGVGEWLDVADAVVLMKNYVAYDGLKKARSVSYQFSYGHVQYAGRGVVHRLPWEVKEEKVLRDEEEENDNSDDVMDVDGKSNTEAATLSPLRRRPLSDCILTRFKDAAVHMPEGSSSRLWLYRDVTDGENDMIDLDEDDGIIDMSKCSQLVGNASEQLYSCGICILWLMMESHHRKDDDIFDLLDRLEEVLEYGGGMNAIISSLLSREEGKEGSYSANANANANTILSTFLSSHITLDLFDTVGFCYHPRRHEVAMALTRMRGLKFEILPEKSKVTSETREEEAKRLEEEAKKKALADLWANRRKRGINST